MFPLPVKLFAVHGVQTKKNVQTQKQNFPLKCES